MRKVKNPKTLTNDELEFALDKFHQHTKTSAKQTPFDPSIHKASVTTLNHLITEKRNRGLYK